MPTYRDYVTTPAGRLPFMPVAAQRGGIPAAAQVPPGAPTMATVGAPLPALLPGRDIVPGIPGPPISVPADLAPLMELFEADNRAALIRMLDLYRDTYVSFWYADQVNLPNLGIAQIDFQLNTDSYFVATALAIDSPNAAANFTVNWRDRAGESIFSSNAVPFNQIGYQIGAAKRYLPRPQVFSRGGVVNFELVDRGTGAAHLVDLAMEGFKLYA